MGVNKDIRKQIKSLSHLIFEHEIKLSSEEESYSPRMELIEHWKKEIHTWKEKFGGWSAA
ncbi:MAG: hypothetical protein ACRD2G_18605 [Terriglobia bacterium]